MKYGLIGNPLGHSHSPYLHGKFGIDGYELHPLGKDELEEFFKRREFSSVNVTIPYKRDVMPLLDDIDPTAAECGAVNTVVNNGGKLTGYNTDVFGMDFALKAAGITLNGKKVVVLGSGGTSHTACTLARNSGAERVTVVSRTGEFNYDNLHLLSDAQVIVNATPVGMYPAIDARPVDLDKFPAVEGVFDAVYNPLRTEFVLQAQRKGIKHASGLLMLSAQAAAAAKIFKEGKYVPFTPDTEDGKAAICACRDLEEKLTNVVLCGMPSSGKTTVGKLLAGMLGKTFVDTDEEICKATGKTIPEIFAEGGEPVFRKAESDVVREVAARQGLVIATGGGALLNPKNAELLKANGYGVFLERDIELLSTEGRPLSKDAETLRKMYLERLPIYKNFADCEADNNGCAEITAATVKEKYYESFGY